MFFRQRENDPILCFLRDAERNEEEKKNYIKLNEYFLYKITTIIITIITIVFYMV